jgi:hypothetical protein
VRTGHKVVALDFDGVLNSHATTTQFVGEFRGTSFQTVGLDPSNVAAFNAFQQQANAKIVVSSSWRWGRTTAELVRILKDAGVAGDVVGATPQLGVRRGIEIQAWLDANPAVSGLVILDDASDMEHLGHKLLRTSASTGFRVEDIPQALRILEQPL